MRRQRVHLNPPSNFSSLWGTGVDLIPETREILSISRHCVRNSNLLLEKIFQKTHFLTYQHPLYALELSAYMPKHAYTCKNFKLTELSSTTHSGFRSTSYEEIQNIRHLTYILIVRLAVPHTRERRRKWRAKLLELGVKSSEITQSLTAELPFLALKIWVQPCLRSFIHKNLKHTTAFMSENVQWYE